MPSRFIIDVISGSGTRAGQTLGKGGTLIVSSSLQMAPTSEGPSSKLFSSYIESWEIEGQPGTGLSISGSAPTDMPGGSDKAEIELHGNLFLKGNILDLSGSTYPYSGSRHSAYETTHVINLAANIPNNNDSRQGPPGVGALTIQGLGSPSPTPLVSFLTTEGDERVIFDAPISGGSEPEAELEIGSNVVIDGALEVGDTTVDGDLTVLGNLTSIDTSHLVIKDPVVYLNSGSTVIGQSAIVFASGSTRNNGSAIGMSVVKPANSMFGRSGENSVVFLSFDAQAGNMPASDIPTSDTNRWVGIYAATGSFLQITGSLKRTTQGADFLQGTGNTTVSYNHGDGAWTINSAGGGGVGTGGNVFRDHGNSGGSSPTSRPSGGTTYSHATTSGSIFFNPGELGDTLQLGDRGMLDAGIGTNVFLYASGTMSRAPIPGTADVGLVIQTSGSILLPDLHLSGALLGVGKTFLGGGGDFNNILQMRAQFVGITDVEGSDFRSGEDNYFFVTGSSLGARNPSGGDSDQGNPGIGGAFAISTVFAGDVITSGSLHLHEAPSARQFGGVELSFKTANPAGSAVQMSNGYRIFVSGSTQSLAISNGALAQVILIDGNEDLAGKVTVTAFNDQTPPDRFIGEMMYATQGNTSSTTFGIGTSVRIAESGGNLATNGGLMLETQQGAAGAGNDQFNVVIRNNTGSTVTLLGIRVLVEHFDV